MAGEKTLEEKLDEFIIQYELDMRGDKDLTNGNQGIIGIIRDLKKFNKEYPSLTWVWKEHPLNVLGAVMGSFIILNMLYHLDILSTIGGIVGLSIP